MSSRSSGKRIPNSWAKAAVTTLSQTMHEHRPFKLWLISNGYQLVALLIMGAILAAWP